MPPVSDQPLPPLSQRDLSRLIQSVVQADQVVCYRAVQVGEQFNLIASASFPDNPAITSHPVAVQSSSTLGKFMSAAPGVHELIDPLLLASSREMKLQDALRQFRSGVVLSLPAGEGAKTCFLLLFKTERAAQTASLSSLRELLARCDGSVRPAAAESGGSTPDAEVAKLREDLTELQRLNRGQLEFIAGLGHELKTPLNSIIGFGSLLEKQVLDEELSEEVDMIMVSANKLLELIEDLIDSYKAAAGKLMLHRSVDDLNGVLMGSVESARVIADEKGITLRIYLAAQIPKFPFDKKRVQQVMNNLLGNALKFVPSGGEIIVRSMLQGDFARVTVTDTGQGIPASSIESIFQRFKQLDGAEDRDHHSAGMGLALSKDFIEMHGGKIKVSSDVGRGSVFDFTLPINVQVDE